MAPAIDYRAMIAAIEAERAKINAAADSAISGIKTMLAMLAPSRPAAQSAAPASTASKPQPRGLFGRDPSEPTLAERAAAVLPQDGEPLPLADIRQKIQDGGKEVSESVLRDILTRKDKLRGRFRRHGRGMFGLNPNYSANNGHYSQK